MMLGIAANSSIIVASGRFSQIGQISVRKTRHPERDRDADRHRNGRGDQGSVDWRERAELVGHRVPDIGVDKGDAEGSQRGNRALDQRSDDAAEDQQNEKRKEKGELRGR